jgi:DNA primase
LNEFQSKIDEIKEKADIVSVISEYVKLEKNGSSYVGLCPFHEDKNPSMSVSSTRKVYKCFSCNASGNVITFIEKFKKIPFMEALREVGQKVGINVQTTQNELLNQKNKKYYDILSDSLNFYHFCLKNTNEGQVALQYLQNRNLNVDIINRFKIGLSMSDSNDLYKCLIDKNYQPIDMIEVGLIKSGNNYFDTFRRRIMFPVTDLNGNVVGFSGRKYLPNSDEAKYINSNENIVFKKSQILYNYYEAFNDIKKQDSIFLFEGFMDVIAAYRASVLNSVASMGTALTFDQIKAIKRLTNNVTLCYDGDVPGIEATKRAIKMLVQNNLNVDVVLMPDGLDPDDYINKYGEPGLNQHLLNEKISAIEYLYINEKNNLLINDINSVERFKNEVFQYLRVFNSNVIIEVYIKRMSKDLGVSINSLSDDFKKTANFVYEIPDGQTIQKPNIDRKIKKSNFVKINKYDSIQKKLINIALTNPEKCVEIESKFNNNYVNNENREIMLQIHQYYYTHKELNRDIIKSKLQPDIANVFEDILNMDFPKHVSEIDLLFKSFDKFPNEKITILLSEEENKTSETLDRVTKVKKATTKFIFDRSDSNDN